MNLSSARKSVSFVNEHDGELRLDVNDPSYYYFEAKLFLERHELRLDVSGEMNLGTALIPGELDLLVAFAGPILEQLFDELDGVRP